MSRLGRLQRPELWRDVDPEQPTYGIRYKRGWAELTVGRRMWRIRWRNFA